MSLAYTYLSSSILLFNDVWDEEYTENNFFSNFGEFFGGKKKSEIVALMVLLSSALKDLAIYV